MSETKKKQRRQRAVLSCNDCRRRKLKCDRELPCNRCINGDIADQCAYGPEAHATVPATLEEHSAKRKREHSTDANASVLIDKIASGTPVDNAYQQPPVLAPTDKTELEQRQCEVTGVKERVTTQRKFLDRRTLENAVPAGEDGSVPYAPYIGFLRGRNYATFFFGPSSVLSIMAHFPDLRAFSKKLYDNSAVDRVAEDLERFENRAKPLLASHRVLSIPNLRSVLPPRSTVDVLVRRYLDTFETTYRVLHIPTFEAAYERYWDVERAPDPGMDALLLGILACAVCTSTHENPRYNHSGSSFQSKAILWIKACEAWLKRQSNKHRSLVSVQVQCLRLIALSVAAYKIKAYYEEVQKHIAFLRSSGFHRDPRVFGDRCSVFEGEMRRRIWATSMELELQASIDKGSLSVLSSLDYDCAAPQNINDVDLTVDLQKLPQPAPLSTFTDTSFLHISASTFALRVKICALTNSLKPSLSFEDMFPYVKAVQKSLKAIPRWKELKTKQAQALLNLQLRQSLLIMYSTRALHNESELGPESHYSIISSLDMSAATIELHAHILNMSNFALSLTRHDYVRAALLICHIAYHASKTKDKLIAQMAKGIFDQCMSKALAILESRMLRHGRGSGQNYSYVSAAAALIGMQFDPSQAETHKLQAVDRLSQIFYTMLSRQDEPTGQSLASEVQFDLSFDQQPLNAPVMGALADPLSTDAFAQGGTRIDGFDVNSTCDWTLDDMWVFNDVPALNFQDNTIPSLW